MGSLEGGSSEPGTGADERTDHAEPPAEPVGPAVGPPPTDTPSTSLEPTLVDIIGRGLLGRHYGVVYDPAPPPEPPAEAAAEPVIDLRVPGTRRSRLLRARWRAFTTYWRGDLLSMIGDHFTLVALPIAANELTHGSGFKVGMVVSVETLATVLFGTMAGTFADRRHPRRLMIASDLIRAAILTLLAVLEFSGHDIFPALVVAAFLLGALRLLSDGARSSFVADLVPDELDVRSNNRLVLAENVGATVGPLLAGAVIAGGLWRAFGIDALSFGCSALAIVLVGRIMRRDHIVERDPEDPGTDKVSYLTESRLAIRAIRADVVFRRALVVVTVFNIVTLPLGPQFVTLATRTLGMSTWEIGLMFAIAGTSGIIAAPLVERDHVIRPGVLVLSTAACGAVVMVVGIRPSIATVAIAFTVGGVAFTFLLTQWAALRQRRFPTDQQGRVTLTARRVMYTSILVGSLLGGWLSDLVDPKALWLAAGAAGLAVAVWGAAVGLLGLRYD